MQINTMGFPAGLLGALGAVPASVTGPSFAHALGVVPSRPANDAGGTFPAMPTLAANDSVVAPATRPLPGAPMTMAHLLTTAAPLTAVTAAVTTGNIVATVPAAATAPAPPAPGAAGPQVTPALPDAFATTMPDPAPAPAEARPVQPPEPPLPAKPSCVMPAPDAPDQPPAPIPGTQAKARSVQRAEPAPAAPSTSAAAAIATPEAVTESAALADRAPSAPVELPAAEATPEAPAEASQTPSPRKPQRRPDHDGPPDVALPDTAASANPVPPTPEMVVAVVQQQVPPRPELAPKPQSSPPRQIGEVAGGGRKPDVQRATMDAMASEPNVSNQKPDAAVATVAEKSGKAHDKRGDDRHAPAFAPRQDAPAPHSAHAANEPPRTQAAPAVATAAAEPVVAARSGHLGQAIGVEIARKVEAGEDTLRVRLSPEHLGKVEVTLAFDDGGTLRATVRAESPRALELLRQDAPDLGRALDQAGIRADGHSFRFESRGDGGSGAQAQQQPGQQRSDGQFAGHDEPEPAQPAYREVRGDGQVDLLA